MKQLFSIKQNGWRLKDSPTTKSTSQFIKANVYIYFLFFCKHMNFIVCKPFLQTSQIRLVHLQKIKLAQKHHYIQKLCQHKLVLNFINYWEFIYYINSKYD